MDKIDIESVTYKTTTTFIHEQNRRKSQFTKKVIGLFLPLWDGSQRTNRQTVGPFSVCMPCKNSSVKQHHGPGRGLIHRL